MANDYNWRRSSGCCWRLDATDVCAPPPYTTPLKKRTKEKKKKEQEEEEKKKKEKKGEEKEDGKNNGSNSIKIECWKMKSCTVIASLIS